MRNCVTHSYACDCREEKFKKIESSLAQQDETIKELEKSNEMLKHQLSYAEAILADVQVDKFKLIEKLNVQNERLVKLLNPTEN